MINQAPQNANENLANVGAQHTVKFAILVAGRFQPHDADCGGTT